MVTLWLWQPKFFLLTVLWGGLCSSSGWARSKKHFPHVFCRIHFADAVAVYFLSVGGDIVALSTDDTGAIVLYDRNSYAYAYNIRINQCWNFLSIFTTSTCLPHCSLCSVTLHSSCYVCASVASISKSASLRWENMWCTDLCTIRPGSIHRICPSHSL